MSKSLLPTSSSLLAEYLSQFAGCDIDEFYKQGTVAVVQTTCNSCAKAIEPGEISHDSGFLGASFGDAPSLKPFSSSRGYLCCDCRVAMSYPPATVQFSYAAIGVDPKNPGLLKAYKIFGVEDFIAAIYNPLLPPFVMVRKERKKQHMIWRGRVNVHNVSDEDLLFFTSGETSLFCHPQMVLDVLSKEQELIQATKDVAVKTGKKKPRALKEIVRYGAIKTNLYSPAIVFNDYRHPSYGIEDEEVLGRLDRFCEIVRQFSSGDRQIYAHLRLLSYLKKMPDVRAMVASLEPREVDMKSIIEGKQSASESTDDKEQEAA